MPRLVLLTPAELTRDPRARRAAAAAVEAGWDVVGICPAAGGDPVDLGGVHVQRVGGERIDAALRSVGLGGGRRDATILRELRGAYRLVRLLRLTFGLRRAGRHLVVADVIHANDFDTLPAGWLLARALGARLVYDAHELYTLQERDPPRLHRAVVRRLERSLARRADAVVTVNEPIARELQAILRLSTRPLVVLNCPASTPRTTSDAVGTPLRSVYQGAVGHGRSLDDLLDAASATEGVHVTLRIVGIDTVGLRAEVERRELDGVVTVAEPVEPTDLVAALAEFDVGIIVTRPLTRNDELAAPNKLFEYLMAGLAVAGPNLPGIAAIIEGDDVGVTFDPGVSASLAAALTALAGRPEEVAALKRRAHEVAVTRFNAESQRPALMTAWGL
jgi:glycosyltransferase involved in cell wall biosynthesis